MTDTQNRGKVVFRLAQDEFGYPPTDAEIVWAYKLSGGTYRIDNIPFYIRGISSDDEIAVDIKDDVVFFRELITPSGNSTFRLLVSDPEKSDQIRGDLGRLGCLVEFNKNVALLAVEIPGALSIEPFLEYVMFAQQRDELDIEEGALRHMIST